MDTKNWNKEEKDMNEIEEDRSVYEDSETEQRDVDIYDIGDLRYDWIEEEDVIYIERGYTGDHKRTSIWRVKASMEELLEDNDKPDIMKWLEVSHELEVFCEAAVAAGRDVIDFDIEVREILDAVWILIEDNENENVQEEEEANGDEGDLESINLGEGEDGPEYYRFRF